jgi:hypothetical protein
LKLFEEGEYDELIKFPPKKLRPQFEIELKNLIDKKKQTKTSEDDSLKRILDDFIALLKTVNISEE